MNRINYINIKHAEEIDLEITISYRFWHKTVGQTMCRLFWWRFANMLFSAFVRWFWRTIHGNRSSRETFMSVTRAVHFFQNTAGHRPSKTEGDIIPQRDSVSEHCTPPSFQPAGRLDRVSVRQRYNWLIIAVRIPLETGQYTRCCLPYWQVNSTKTTHSHTDLEGMSTLNSAWDNWYWYSITVQRGEHHSLDSEQLAFWAI